MIRCKPSCPAGMRMFGRQLNFNDAYRKREAGRQLSDDVGRRIAAVIQQQNHIVHLDSSASLSGGSGKGPEAGADAFFLVLDGNGYDSCERRRRGHHIHLDGNADPARTFRLYGNVLVSPRSLLLTLAKAALFPVA